MNEYFVFVFSSIMLFLTAFFILFFVTWNRKSLKYQKYLHDLKTKSQRDLLRATIAGQEKERKRIAENLHDDMGPLLSSLKLQAKSLAKDPSNYEEFQSTVNTAIQNIKSVSKKLSPLVFEELGLNKAVRHTVDQMTQITGIDTRFQWDAGLENTLAEPHQLGCFRIIQEAMNNVVKHAQATSMSVISEIRESGETIIKIEDDGIGIQPNKSANIGLGLSNMEARAESMNAKLHISSTNSGTCIVLTIPKNTKDGQDQNSAGR